MISTKIFIIIFIMIYTVIVFPIFSDLHRYNNV